MSTLLSASNRRGSVVRSNPLRFVVIPPSSIAQCFRNDVCSRSTDVSYAVTRVARNTKELVLEIALDLVIVVVTATTTPSSPANGGDSLVERSSVLNGQEGPSADAECRRRRGVLVKYLFLSQFTATSLRRRCRL